LEQVLEAALVQELVREVDQGPVVVVEGLQVTFIKTFNYYSLSFSLSLKKNPKKT
jgi:hypothetical protein